MLISNIAHLVDLLSAGAFCEASSELSDDKRDTEAIGVLSSLANSLLVPFEALGLMSDRRLTSEALGRRQLAAVGVIVEHMLVATNLATGWGLETDWEDEPAQDTDLIGQGNWFEPHLLVSIVTLVLLEDLSVERSQVFLVHVTRLQKHEVSGWVGWEWLVQWVVSNNVGVVRQAG